MPMLPHVPFISDECILSWADRSAQIQTGKSLPDLLTFVGLPQTRFEPMADLATLDILIDLFGGERSALEASVIFKHDDAMRRFRHEVFRPSLLRHREAAFCPMCLIKDGEHRHGHVSWQLTTTTCCDRHGIALVTTPTETQFAALVPSLAFPDHDTVDNFCRTSTPTLPTPLQCYVERRMSAGKRDPIWFDGCRLDQVVNMSKCLGNALMDHTDDNRATASHIGFEALSRGDIGISAALNEVLCHRSRNARVNTPLRALGRLYEAVKINEDLAPLRPSLKSFMLDNVALAAGDDLFGERLPARRKHDLTSLSIASGLPKMQLVKVFGGLGLLEGAGDRSVNAYTFDVATSEVITRELRASIPANMLSAHLGCDATTALAVLNAGLVERVFNDRVNGERDGDALKRISLDSIHDLLGMLFERATILESYPVEFSSLSAAARHSHWQVDRVIQLVLSGRLDLHAQVGRTDFDGLLVDERQLRRVLEAPPMTDAVTKEDAARALGTDVPTVEKIMRTPDITGAPIIRRVVPLVGPMKNRHQVAKPDFDQFQRNCMLRQNPANTEGEGHKDGYAAWKKHMISMIPS